MNSLQKTKYFDKLWLVALFTTLLVTILVYTINYFYSDDFSIFDSISLFLYTLIPGCLVLVSIWAIKSNIFNDIPKKSLIFLTLSFVCWFTAEQLWMLFDYVFDIDPWPSVADIFYISAPILMLISLTIFLKPFKNRISKKTIVVATSLSLSLLIPTVIFTYAESGGSNLIELLIVIIYPVSDALVIIPAIIIFSVVFNDKKNTFWALLLIGIFVLIAADTLFLFLILTEDYHDNHPVDLLWLVSYLVWTFALLRSIYSSKKPPASTDIETYKKYESGILSRYGVIGFLIIINTLVIVVLFSIHNLLATQSDFEFLEFFTAFLVIMMIIFSGLIVLLNKTMHKNLETRTSELENISKDFIKSERLTAIGELSARISHDIRNPLSILSFEFTLLQQKNLLDKKQTRRITNSLNRISHQIDEVLDYVRITPLQYSKFNLTTIVHDSLDSIVIPDKVKVNIPSDEIIIKADRNKMEIVLINLILNAVQAVGTIGTVDVTLSETSKEIIIKIKDSGTGITVTPLDDIFDPLITTKEKGTGLGLASVKNIIEQHHGSIFVETNPTIFTIKIPKEAEMN